MEFICDSVCSVSYTHLDVYKRQEHGLGGLLQGATYLAGLSGGNWLTSTLAWNNWTSVQAIVDNTTESNSIWDISHSILTPGGINIFKTGSRWDDISDDVQAKQDAGFNISLALSLIHI